MAEPRCSPAYWMRWPGCLGCRPAEPGEFTRRAFLNGKLDLTAAEGLADLVDATTRAQARQALRQLDRRAGPALRRLARRLLSALALIEAEIDFGPDGEEVPANRCWHGCSPDLAACARRWRVHLADGERGERLRRGITVAVIGAPMSASRAWSICWPGARWRS